MFLPLEHILPVLILPILPSLNFNFNFQSNMLPGSCSPFSFSSQPPVFQESKSRNFAGFFNSFWISRHFNFAAQPKYYIFWHFNFLIWAKYYNLRHFIFAVVLKIEFFICVRLQYFRSFGKNMAPKCELKYILIFLYKPIIYKSINSTRKNSFWFKNMVIFIIWVYSWIYKYQDLTTFLVLPPMIK